MKSFRMLLVALVVPALHLSGCGKKEDLRTYTAEKSIKPVAFNTPEGWYRVGITREQQSFGMLYAWEASENQPTGGKHKARITLSLSTRSRYDLLEDINRWRRQLRFKEELESQDQLQPPIKPLEVDGNTIQYIQLVGPPDAPRREAIWVAVRTDEIGTWFLKFQGPVDLAQRQKSTFEAWIPRAFRAIEHAVQ